MPTGHGLSLMQSVTRSSVALATVFGLAMPGWSAVESSCPAPIATCALPAPMRHDLTIATYFHTGGVVTLTTSTEPECADPIATCIQPAAYAAQLPEAGLYWRAERHPAVSEVLQCWSAASGRHATWTATEKHWLARRHQPWLSAVTLDAVVRLSSSVDEASLVRDFAWTVDGTEDDVTILRAVPTDETQRLFCPQLRVELDATTHTLTAIDVADRTGTWRPIDLPWAVLPPPSHGTEAIVLTGNKVEIELTGGVEITEAAPLPPSPTSPSPLRFAADRIEFHVTTPR